MAVSEYQSLKTEYKKCIEHHSNELLKSIIEFDSILNVISSSPIPFETIDDVTSKSHSVLSRLMESIDFVKESTFIVESLDYSAGIEKFNTAKSQLKDFIPVFQDYLAGKYLQEIELLFSLWKDLYKINAYWCKQHFLNGQSSFSLSHIESLEYSILDGAGHFCHDCICILNKLYNYAEHQNKAFQDFHCDIS